MHTLFEFVLNREFDLGVTSNRPEFRDELLSANHLSRGSTLRCWLLNRPLPYDSVIAAHIFPRKWSHSLSLLELYDVDDVRNGIFLYKPIEVAFDLGWIIFVWNASIKSYVCHLLNPNIKNDSIDACARRYLKKGYVTPAVSVTENFSGLEGLQLSLGSSVPYRRVFAFHAHRCRINALNQGWIKDNDVVDVLDDDIWSEGDLRSPDAPWRGIIENWRNKVDVTDEND